jgi:hypothetical protein
VLDEFRIGCLPRSTFPYPLHRCVVLRFIERVIARQVAKAQAGPPPPPAVRSWDSSRITPGLMFLSE